MTPVMYPASFFFNEPSAAYIFLIVINLFTGITCIVSSFLLEIFSYDKVVYSCSCRVIETCNNVTYIFRTDSMLYTNNCPKNNYYMIIFLLYM